MNIKIDLSLNETLYISTTLLDYDITLVFIYIF